MCHPRTCHTVPAAIHKFDLAAHHIWGFHIRRRIQLAKIVWQCCPGDSGNHLFDEVLDFDFRNDAREALWLAILKNPIDPILADAVDEKGTLVEADCIAENAP